MAEIVRKGRINICRLVLGSMETNTYIVYNNSGEGFLVDPAEDADTIKETLAELGVTIGAILLTHGHFDHIGALKAVKALYEAKVYACESEREILENSGKNLSEAFTGGFTAEADCYVTDGEELEIAGFHLSVLHTPGHTAGSVCYLVEKEDEKVLFSGDTLFAGSHGRYDFPTGSYRALMQSIKEKLLVLEEDLRVYPGHNEETTIGEEKNAY